MNFKKCSFLSLQMEIRNNLLHLSRVMTRPVQYTYNRCQFVTRSWFIYAIRCARLLLPGFPLPTYSSNKNCTFIHFFTCTIIWFTGENVLSAANFKFFFVWIFSNSYFFYLPVHVFYYKNLLHKNAKITVKTFCITWQRLYEIDLQCAQDLTIVKIWTSENK